MIPEIEDLLIVVLTFVFVLIETMCEESITKITLCFFKNLVRSGEVHPVRGENEENDGVIG